MSRTVLHLTGEERTAANATHWARLRTAAGGRIVVVAHGPADRPATSDVFAIHDPGALAALLVDTVGVPDGATLVLAACDPAFATALAAEIGARGRRVTCTDGTTELAFSTGV